MRRVYGAFVVSPGNWQHSVQLPTTTHLVFYSLMTHDPGDAQFITYDAGPEWTNGYAQENVDSWNGSITVPFIGSSTASGDVTILFELLLGDEYAPRIKYNGA